MDTKLFIIIDESIQLELNIAELYKVFHEEFSEDTEFWWKLFMEEENHAELIKSAKKMYDVTHGFLAEMLSTSIEDLIAVNNRLVSLISEYRTNPPTREEAFNVAIELEEAPGPINFQRFMEKKSNERMVQIFQQLNKDDKDHAARLRSHMEKHGIRIRRVNRERTSKYPSGQGYGLKENWFLPI